MFEHQKVKVIGITKPLIEGIDTAEELIAFQARVSNPSNQMNNNTAAGLLKYCMKNQHWSIFEMVNINFEIQTTRDIARQFIRHKSILPQEYSQRYADPIKDLEFVIREARMQDSKNRQNSIECTDPQIQAFWEQYQKRVIEEATNAYQWAVDHGIAKEQARVVLPEGNTMSRLYANCNLRSLIHYCNVRRDISTQKEHRDIAEKMWQASFEHFKFLTEL